MNKAFKTSLIFALACYFAPIKGFAAFTNYNSILIGDRAAGMGGAYTALSEDPSACSYYNPATLSRMEGHTFSAAVSVYNKYDTVFGVNDDFSSAPLRVNQGAFVPVPTSSGSVYSFRNFAIALSIVIPDSDTYNGEVNSDDNSISLLNLKDESLWVGGTLAVNTTEKSAVGMTMYYTSRNFSSSVTDRRTVGTAPTTDTFIVNEEKTLTNNSVITILGHYYQLTPNWTLGLSHRFSSIEISGRGTLFQSTLGTEGTNSNFNEINISSETRVPAKSAFGIAYEEKGKLTLSADISYHDSERYRDLEHPLGDTVTNKPTFNINLGSEYYYKSWLALRFGIYSNFASSPEIPNNPSENFPDHVDMWGFSANAAIYSSKQSSITLGGYYSGGKGHSVQSINGQLKKIPKSQQTFTLLVGTTFRL